MTDRSGRPGPEPGDGAEHPDGPYRPARRTFPGVWFGGTEELVDLDAADAADALDARDPRPPAGAADAAEAAQPGGLFRPRAAGPGSPFGWPAARAARLRPWADDPAAADPDADDEPDGPAGRGRLVRLYTLTGGRTRSAADLDLIAQVVAADRYAGGDLPDDLGPEQEVILELVRDRPISVAEVAAGADLPLGITRVLLGDLIESGLIRVSRPVPAALLPDERILREVINGLRAL